jgi:hypothetical protein
MSATPKALLQGVPDARRAGAPLLPAVFLPYAALMMGAGVSGLLALYNAVALRRWRLASLTLVVALVGWVGFGLVFALVVGGGTKNVVLALLPARLLNVGLGAVLAWSQWAHVRGHEFLDGRTVPLLHAVLGTFAAAVLMPTRLRLVLEGLWVMLLD